MTFDTSQVRDLVNKFKFQRLFIEHLGWDRHGGDLSVRVGNDTWQLTGLAQKRGVQILECRAPDEAALPDYNTRKKIEKEITKVAYEHLIIFSDNAQTVQIWQWVARAPGTPAAYREITHHPHTQSGDLLLQKLIGIRFTLDEEESIDIAGASHRLRDAFDRDKVTKKFYQRFKDEQQAFLDFIEGIADQGDRKWYASLMLNRLMFVWFIQEKGFLDGNKAYLQDRLTRVCEIKGKGQFHTFYRYFLLALFHEGFGKREQDRELDGTLTALLGQVPYLNGGLFDPHEIEKANEGIHIPDEAFERLFAFFGEFDWHLDTRTISKGNEINPDVLGYIFEKYINQKEMGAYYTKEDITGYIGKNTILPFLFDAAEKKCRVAFEPGSALWRLLRDEPDAFIYPAMRKGVIDDDGKVIPLPPEIENGIDTSKPNLLERRKGWNAPATEPYALPTEIWREHIARRQRCLEIRDKLRKGDIHNINDLITYNLDIRQFAERAISECEGPELLRAFWQAIRSMTILDPTCGSGAFLFAALEILYPLYDACLTRMEGFIEDLDRSKGKHSPKKYSNFRDVLEDIGRHPSRDYFILKSVIVHNLYGVDIMPEAVEICKLRLFLKLVSQIERVEQLEPLPDIDFNIRAGNTLVGFTSLEEIRQALSGDLVKQLELPEIEEQAKLAAQAYATFHEMQTIQGMDSGEFTAAKQSLRERLSALGNRLNIYLAEVEYGVNVNDDKKYGAWVKSHLPFHWFVEFYGIMTTGGFSVTIGNPPYVEMGTVKKEYTIKGFDLLDTGNLFAICTERFAELLEPRTGRLGIILPISAISTPRMTPLMKFLTAKLGALHVSNFAVRPGKLFVGVDMNLSIILGTRSVTKNGFPHVTHYTRWQVPFRLHLFESLTYYKSMLRVDLNAIPKIGSKWSASVLAKTTSEPKLASYRLNSSAGDSVFYHSGGRYYRKCLRRKLSNEYKPLRVRKGIGPVLQCLLSSSLYYVYWIIASDTYHVTRSDVDSLHVPEALAHDARFSILARRLEEDLWANAERRIRQRADGTKQEEVNFNVSASKTILDKIDQALAEHYSLDEVELDFVLNYDVKFRGGHDE